MKTYKERFIIGLLVVVLAGVGYLFFHDNQKQKEDKEFKSMMESLKSKQELDQMRDYFYKDSSQLAWEEKMTNLMSGLGYSKKRIEDSIIKHEDELFSIYDKDWYKEFKKKYH